MLNSSLEEALKRARIGRRYLLKTIGGPLLAEWHSSGAFTVRPPGADDQPYGGHSNELSGHARLHYGGTGWGCFWTEASVGNLLVFSTGAFTVKTLNEQGYREYRSQHSVDTAPTADDFLEELLSETPSNP